MRVLPGPTKSNQVLAWSPDGRFVVAGGTGDGVMVWDLTAGTPGRRVLMGGHGGRLMRFCPRTGRLYVAFQTGGFCHWEPNEDEECFHTARASYSQFYGMAVDPDGRTVVASLYRARNRELVGFTVPDTGRVRERWARRDDRWADAFTFRSGTGELFGLGRRVDGQLRFEWMPPEATDVSGSFLVPPGGRVTRWVLSPDGDRVAWLTERALFLRQLDDPATLELPAAEGEIRRGLAFHPSGRVLAYTTGTTVRFLDADTFTEIRALDWGTGKARAVAFSPDGLRAAVSGEGGKGWVTVFDLE